MVRLAGHVSRIQSLVGKIEGKRLAERYRSRWKYIKMTQRNKAKCGLDLFSSGYGSVVKSSET
jgi:hypothetical protein